MSTLKVTHLQNENGTGPAMSLAVGGGVTFAGITTFHNGVDSGERLTIGGSTVTDSNLLTLNGSGATQNVGFVLNKTNSPAKAYGMQVNNSTGDLLLFDYAESAERMRVGTAGSVHIGPGGAAAQGHGLLTLTQSASAAFNALVVQQGNTGYNLTDGLHIGIDGGVNAYFKLYENRDIYFTTGTSNTEKLRITSTGRVGIKTTNPDELLEVGDGTVDGGLKVSGQSSGVTSDGFTVDWEASTDSARLFSEPQSGGSSQFKIYTTNSGTRSLAATFDSSGNLVFPNGQGIDFSASAGSGISAGGGVLDDYEEGTFTPGMTIGGLNTTASHQYGIYVKVGRLVTCFGRLTLTSNGSGTGGATFTGLPFTVADLVSTTALEGGGFFTYQNNVAGAYGAMSIMPSQGSTDATIYYAQSANGNMIGASEANIANNFDSRFVFSYHTTAT